MKRGDERYAVHGNGREHGVVIGAGYPSAQLARAFRTALAHEDAETRRRAEERAVSWERVLQGMADGTLEIGSPAPVRDLPSWVTLEVVRGGFATGEAASGGPLLPYEIEAAERAGVPADRRALFYYHLTDAGLAELGALLDSGRYQVVVPEEGALLTVAWLLRAGDPGAALSLLDRIEPFAGLLRFLPRPSATAPGDAEIVHRRTAGQARGALAVRRPSAAVAAMNEALSVWNPFADELLAHWLETAEDGRAGRRITGAWLARGEELLARYERLAAEHTLCTKHRRPKENLAILRTALEETVTGSGPARPGLLQHAVDSMVRRRGAPGSAGHGALRERQAGIARRPTHGAFARILVERLAPLVQEAGILDLEPLLAPVTADEERRTGVPAGGEVPEPLREIVESALAAPIGTLVERGVVPSAEVMAELVPQLVAWTTAQSYADAPLRTLMAAVYRAFRDRRSLLLLNLEGQVKLTELPWVRAAHEHRLPGGGAHAGARDALVRLGDLALRAFPGTILPNPLVRELDALARSASIQVPLTEELAADIFMGAFSGKFLDAAKLAADLLEGTLYERYYGIDYAAVRSIGDTRWRGRFATPTSRSFAELCAERAGATSLRSYRAAENGMVIEQAQILTTHNLAALVHPIGVDPEGGWAELARGAFATVCRRVERVERDPRPLGAIKDAAYAWRQAVFFLALCGPRDQVAVAAWMQDEADRRPGHAAARLAPVLAGLRHVLLGRGSLDGTAVPGARRFLGWDAERHWMRDVTPDEKVEL
ncbi:transcriptional regulator [Spirillospora sp. NPDC029432]|uniref:transcriptional regulator n=1 Tax=Spirillospora sp. NPDC029432 TaxID=3154599 RepID=UPI003452796D